MSAEPHASIAEIEHRLADVTERVRAAGGDHVRIVGVTKRHPVELLVAAVAAGVVDLGENYAQEFAAKRSEVTGAHWHFIGQLQTNKVRLVLSADGPDDAAVTIQSVDRNSLVDAIARIGPGTDVFIQMDLSGVAGRGGAAPDEVESLVERAVDRGLVVRGLMAVAPLDAGESEVARGFASVRRRCDELGLGEASMGMSEDFELAVAEGSTMIRIGSALFGMRS